VSCRTRRGPRARARCSPPAGARLRGARRGQHAPALGRGVARAARPLPGCRWPLAIRGRAGAVSSGGRRARGRRARAPGGRRRWNASPIAIRLTRAEKTRRKHTSKASPGLGWVIASRRVSSSDRNRSPSRRTVCAPRSETRGSVRALRPLAATASSDQNYRRVRPPRGTKTAPPGRTREHVTSRLGARGFAGTSTSLREPGHSRFVCHKSASPRSQCPLIRVMGTCKGSRRPRQGRGGRSPATGSP